MISVCGAKVERSDLATTVVRPEKAGRIWRGVPHRELADELVQACEARDIEVVREQWSVARNGAALVGGLDVRVPGLEPPDGQTFCLAYMGDNALFRANRIAVGTNVMVCDNGVCTGTFVLQRRHTLHLNLPVVMNEAVDRAFVQFNKTGNVIKSLQEHRMSPFQVDRAFMNMGRYGVLAWSQIGKAWKQYNLPEHREDHGDRGKAWSVYQAANHVIKQRPPAVQIEGLEELTQLLLPGKAA